MPSSSTRRILLSDIAATPWKNGGGVTRVIATGPSPAVDHDWGWRFSLAEVEQDGPFSLFPGIDRLIAVIAGEGMDLIHADGRLTALEPFQAVGISGDEALFGRLRHGSVRDLNVMTRRGHFEATLELWQGPRGATAQSSGGDWLVIHNLAGRCAVATGGGATYDLAPSETLVHEGQIDIEIRLAVDSRAAVISIRSLRPGPPI